MLRTSLGHLVSGIVSRWTLLAAIAAVLAWNVHLRIDQLGVPTMQGTTVSAAAATATQDAR
jgi:hypothetical protein